MYGKDQELGHAQNDGHVWRQGLSVGPEFPEPTSLTSLCS
jgi:hypothetical protein